MRNFCALVFFISAIIGEISPSAFCEEVEDLTEIPHKSLDTSNSIEPIQSSILSTIPVIGFGKYPWHRNILTTIFWIGESPTVANPKAKASSAWDTEWQLDYGDYDPPNPLMRRNFIPVDFTPKQNPFYIQLPYSDVANGLTKTEATMVIPWFNDAFEHQGQSVLKDRWVAIHYNGRTCFAQWEDVGPYYEDDWKYVFGNGTQEPRQNSNGTMGMEISPAIRDYLQMGKNGYCDWKFVDATSVPDGPWKYYGNNNTFVLMRNHANLFENDRNNVVRSKPSPSYSSQGIPDPTISSPNIPVNTTNSIPTYTYTTQSSDNKKSLLESSLLYAVIGIAPNDVLNAHTGPGGSYPICLTLPYGTTELKVHPPSVMNGDTEWIIIEYLGKTGWVAKSYLQVQ